MSVYAQLGVATIINAKGTATRLSGGIMRPEVAEAMKEASQACVDMAGLQAAASREIAAVTGAEAGYVASGASACLLLAAAACMAGLDPGRMARLPDARGMRNEIVMVRSQRNFYDHAIRAAGATIVEVGLPDRFAGAGVRDASAWEIEDAINDNTAAIFHVAGASASPPLPVLTAIAGKHGIPVIVDAAAQLPPQTNLTRFISEGADLVAFSGGKAIGGPQASGLLCGRRDLIMSAALQHLDLDVFEEMWSPPPSLIDRQRLKGIPQHGIGRSCKAGKEEIVGLLTALRLFVAQGDAARHATWVARLESLRTELGGAGVPALIEGSDNDACIPLLVISAERATPDLVRGLIARGVHVDDSRRADSVIAINPMALADRDISPLASALKAELLPR